MPQSTPTTFAQITSRGRFVQEKSPKITILDFQQGVGSGRHEIRSAYLHVPFCFHKCHYCDFYSIVDTRDRQEQFVSRLISELHAAAPLLSPPLKSIFIGGGTPTLLAPALWQHLLNAINRLLPLDRNGEFTVEANPETVTDELAAVLASGGVNRVSIGCQSFNPTHLKALERWHDPANVERSVECFRRAGISNINLDLIFAIPGQTLEDWQRDLDHALALSPMHVSCYGLVYEPNTPLTVKMRAGDITPCEQDLEAAMYRHTMNRLGAAGFEHYEISNWARIADPQTTDQPHSRFRSAHNLAYWTNQNWWPFGPSASGHVSGIRWKNVPRLGEYLDHGPLPPIVDAECVDLDSRIGEEFMLGLRLVEGMPLSRVEELLAVGSRAAARRSAIERHIAAGLLERAAGRLRFRAQGLMLADAALSDLI